MVGCNIVVWLIGVGLFALGLYIFLEGKDYSALMDASLFSVAVVIIVVGFFIALVGFLGCCGAVKKSSCMLLIYSIFLLFIIILQLTTAILAFVFRATAIDKVRGSVLESLAAYGGPETEEEVYTKALDLAQENLKCCGMTSNMDYSDAEIAVFWVSAGNSADTPDSCCLVNTAGCGKLQADATVERETVHVTGCLVTLEDFVKYNMQAVGIAATVFLVVEIFNMAFSFLLWKRYK